MPANLESSAVATRLEKVSFIPIPKAMLKNAQTNRTIALISHTSKVMLKNLYVRLQQYVNRELQDVQASFGKVRGITDKVASICWIIKKARAFQKKKINLFLLY